MRDYFKAERDKLKVMTFREKRQYIWEYYKVHILATLGILTLFGTVIYTVFINPPQRDYIYIAWVGVPVSFEELDNLSAGLSVIVPDSDRYVVRVTDYSSTGNPQIDMSVQSRFLAMLQIGSIDLFISSLEGITEISEQGFLQSIDALPTDNPDLSERIAQRSIWAETNEAFMFVSLENSQVFAAAGIDTSDLYLGVLFNTGRLDLLAELMGVIFDE